MNTPEAQDRKASPLSEGQRAARQAADARRFTDTAGRQRVPFANDGEEPYSNVPCTD